MSVHFRPITDQKGLEALQRFLRDNKLPYIDLKLEGNHFIVYEDDAGNLIGSGGLELYGATALLRSIAVDEKLRGQAFGGKIVDEMISKARILSINELFLLTETARDYFLKKGFEDVPRNEVPETIKETTEFAQVCPASAVVMKLKIS